MQEILPKCIKNNKCHSVCNVRNCRNLPFICIDDECECYSIHKNCISNIRWKKLKQMFEDKIKHPHPQSLKCIERIKQLYRQIIQQINKSLKQFQQMAITIGLSQLQKDIFKKLKQKRFIELDGSIIYNFEAQIEQKKNIEVRNIQKEQKQIKKITQQLKEMLKNLHIPKQVVQQINRSQMTLSLSSLIVDNSDCIQRFFGRKIKSIDLLFRASLYDFQVGEFWDRCDQQPNTITLIKTQQGNIIGGYTPLAWKKQLNGHFQKDSTKQSFLFSITQNCLLKLNDNQEWCAIVHNVNSGPVFGYGHDLIVYDKANIYRNSYADTGQTYILHHSNNKQRLKQSEYFLIEEWQVHQIVFVQ